MKKGAVCLAALGFFLLLAGGVLLGAYCVGTDAATYLAVSRETADLEYIGLTQEENDRALTALSRYLRGEDSALDGTPFHDREKAHMVDVRALFSVCARLSAACLIWGGALVCALAGRAGRKGLLYGALLSWLALGPLALPAAFSAFDELFLGFHRLLFSNDLWLMDPRTDVMIRMLPQAFFEKMARLLLCPAWPLGAQAAGFLCAEGIRAASTRGGKRHRHAIRADRP